MQELLFGLAACDLRMNQATRAILERRVRQLCADDTAWLDACLAVYSERGGLGRVAAVFDTLLRPVAEE